jgi:hypothetical protein
MPRLAKACLAAVAALALMLIVPASAMAADPAPSPSPTVYGCIDGEDDYGNPLPCELRLEILTPICDNDVPKLRYKAVAVGTPNNTLTITWVNPGGADIVQSGLPLEGTVLWPGAEQDANGNALDWPGWRLEDGVWVEGDQYDWLRPSVQVKFEVNPEMTETVGYPPSSPDCLTDPPESEVLVDNPLPPEVAETGSEVAPLLIGGAVLVAVGVLTVALVNRRRGQA